MNEQILPATPSLRLLRVILRIGVVISIAFVALWSAIGLFALLTDSGQMYVERTASIGRVARMGQSLIPDFARLDDVAEPIGMVDESVNYDTGIDGLVATDVNYTYAVPGAASRVVIMLSGLLASFAVAFTFWQLLKVVTASIKDDPFTERNAKRLRVTGLVLIAVPLLKVAADLYLSTRFVEGVRRVFGLSLGSGASGSMLLVGLALLALAGVFERGVRLREFEQATI